MTNDLMTGVTTEAVKSLLSAICAAWMVVVQILPPDAEWLALVNASPQRPQNLAWPAQDLTTLQFYCLQMFLAAAMARNPIFEFELN